MKYIIVLGDGMADLPIKEIDNKNNITVDYAYEFGVVEDSDVIRPDTTEYTIIE